MWINNSKKAKNSIRNTYKNFDKNFDEKLQKNLNKNMKKCFAIIIESNYPTLQILLLRVDIILVLKIKYIILSK